MTPAYRQRVIPVGAWIAAGAAFLFVLLVLTTLTTRHMSREAKFIFPLISLAVAGNILLVGYVYGDARRRGMRYVMWTLLSIFLFWGVGIILYFILREPLLGFCSKCGSPANHGFAYCPRCGAGLRPSCPACHRVIEGPWAHCAWCGAKVA